ncbi:MAG: hypothetical protein HQ509_08925 [Candidatus Marinimicrobia bacterium]|nr:hypothetical protein [Candidatus Neomarinimicrobiota bacterium]
MKSSIIHLRLRDFELQAERTMDTSLRTRPVAIISSHRQDGTVVSTSSEAKNEGLYSGMKVSLARKMSHGVLLLPYNRSLYARLNSYIYSTVSSYTPIVEPSGFGQFYLDMTGMDTVYSSFIYAGEQITKKINTQASVSGSVAISINKLVSRIATSVVPDPVYEILRGREAQFLSPLETPVLPTAHQSPVKKIVRFLYLDHVRHVQSVIQHPDEARVLFGPFAKPLSREAQGQDTSVVKPPTLQDHILEQVVLPDDTNDETLLRAIVSSLAEQVGFKLRQRGQIARQVKLEIHYTDGFQSARTGGFSTNDDMSLSKVCHRLFGQANYRRNRVRAVLIDATHFQQHADQANLFITPDIKRIELSKALDRIRGKHGFAGIQSATMLKVNPTTKEKSGIHHYVRPS